MKRQLVFVCDDGSRFEQRRDPSIYPMNDIRDRFGYDTVTATVFVLERGSESTPQRLFCRYVAKQKGDRYSGELGLWNASMHSQDAIGTLKGYLVEIVEGGTTAEPEFTTRVILRNTLLFDQCGVFAFVGDVFYAPDREKLDQLLAPFDFSSLPTATLNAIAEKVRPGLWPAWGEPYSPGTEQHHPSRDRNGSPGAKFYDRTMFAWKAFPAEHLALRPIAQNLAVEAGSVVTEHDGTVVKRYGRPHWLFRWADEKFLQPYEQEMEPHTFKYGTIDTERPAFGRENVPLVSLGHDETESMDLIRHKRAIWPAGYLPPERWQTETYRGGQITAKGALADANEHRFHAMELISLFLLTGSPTAQDGIITYLEAAREKDGTPWEEDYSDRSEGWTLQTFVLGAFALGGRLGEKYWKIVHKMIEQLEAEVAKQPEWARPWYFLGSSRYHRNDGGDWKASEAWKVATIVQGLRLAKQLDPDDSWKPRYDAHLQKGMNILRKSAVRWPDGTLRGFSKFVVVTPTSVGPDLTSDYNIMLDGVGHWVSAALWNDPLGKEAFALLRQRRDWKLEEAAEKCFEWHPGNFLVA